jgi:MSHA biogenesis protein MshK
MADRLMLAQAIVTATALVLSAGSTAQALTDPTRPPLELMSAATTGAAMTAAAPRTPLQSILLSSARKGAIINGQYVALGGTYGKAKLVKITPTEVTLKSDQGLEVLQLYPPLEKTSAVSRAEGKPGKVVKRP